MVMVTDLNDMDIISTPPYEEMQKLYARYFSLGSLGCDIMNKFALISFICHIKHKISKKRPDVTYYEVVKKIAGDSLPEDLIKGLAVVCSDFGYCCDKFPTFDIEDRNIIDKAKDIIGQYLPF